MGKKMLRIDSQYEFLTVFYGSSHYDKWKHRFGVIDASKIYGQVEMPLDTRVRPIIEAIENE
jgi:hypothetical protein